MLRIVRTILAFAVLGAAGMAANKTAGQKKDAPSAIEEYIREANAYANSQGSTVSSGSLYSPNARFADLARDLRASQVGDLVTIVVSDRASAVAKGTTNSSRKSSANYSVSALAGPTRTAGPWANLAGVTGDQQLQGQGETTRETVLTTTLSARVTNVLPNGYLVVEGDKEIVINSERQAVQVRGVLRWNDLTPANQIRSDRLAALEVRINGKGVVGDAIRRPFFLYRILLGLLPF